MQKAIKLSKSAILAAILVVSGIRAQNAVAQKMTIGVIGIEVSGLDMSFMQMGDLVRLELEKTNNYNVLDKYDVIAELNKMHTRADSCVAKSCLISIGKDMKADKMISGSIDRFGNRIVLSMRLINVNTGELEKSQVDEYINVPENVQQMVKITSERLLGQPVDEDVAQKLTKKDDYESEINNPGYDKLTLNGPRMGVSFLLGDAEKRFVQPKASGGYDASPFLFVFGYQQEIQYLNSGRYQALFEMVPAIVGIDKGFFIPTCSFLNGLRDNKSGWEFGIGATFQFMKTAEFWVDTISHQEMIAPLDLKPGTPTTTHLDSRGDLTLMPGFIFAVGKSFRSGRMNIPFNAFVVPSKNAFRAGITFGWNAKKNYTGSSNKK